MKQQPFVPIKIIKRFRALHLAASKGDEEAKRAMLLMEEGFPGVKSAALTDSYLKHLVEHNWPEAPLQEIKESILTPNFQNEKFKYIPTNDLLSELRIKKPELFQIPEPVPAPEPPKSNHITIYVICAVVVIAAALLIFLL